MNKLITFISVSAVNEKEVVRTMAGMKILSIYLFNLFFIQFLYFICAAENLNCLHMLGG